MSRRIYCVKLKQEAEGMEAPPFPGPLGERLYQQVSKEGFNLWLAHQTMLINEYRLNLMEPKSREYLRSEMQNYFFGEGSEPPAGYKNT